MEEVVFVDTSAWIATLVQTERNNRVAVDWMTANSNRLVTTDYVVDETLTFLRSRGKGALAIVACAQLTQGELCELIHVGPSDFHAACRCFCDHPDKLWSLTDCSSKVLIERLGITRAFAFDRHFSQFASVQVVPSCCD